LLTEADAVKVFHDAAVAGAPDALRTERFG
jgi:hypothetical protein